LEFIVEATDLEYAFVRKDALNKLLKRSVKNERANYERNGHLAVSSVIKIPGTASGVRSGRLW